MNKPPSPVNDVKNFSLYVLYRTGSLSLGTVDENGKERKRKSIKENYFNRSKNVRTLHTYFYPYALHINIVQTLRCATLVQWVWINKHKRNAELLDPNYPAEMCSWKYYHEENAIFSLFERKKRMKKTQVCFVFICNNVSSSIGWLSVLHLKACKADDALKQIQFNVFVWHVTSIHSYTHSHILSFSSRDQCLSLSLHFV